MTARRVAGKKKSRAGQLRIVAGIWRSRLMQIADVPGLRPTSERIRETLFNWLAPRIEGSRCLDLCAGTGALGIEALSRGAAHVSFVERSKVAAATLRQNLATLNAESGVIHNLSAESFLQKSPTERFDIVFLDPPFAAAITEDLCHLLDAHNWLTGNAEIYIESDKAQPVTAIPAGWSITKNKTAGNVRYMLATATRE